MITVINSPSLTVSFKRRGWCLWYYLNEAGLTVIQVGPLVIEYES